MPVVYCYNDEYKDLAFQTLISRFYYEIIQWDMVITTVNVILQVYYEIIQWHVCITAINLQLYVAMDTVTHYQTANEHVISVCI